MTTMTLTPGALTLDQLQALHTGGVQLTLDDAARPNIRASAAVVQAAAAGWITLDGGRPADAVAADVLAAITPQLGPEPAPSELGPVDI